MLEDQDPLDPSTDEDRHPLSREAMAVPQRPGPSATKNPSALFLGQAARRDEAFSLMRHILAYKAIAPGASFSSSRDRYR